eukprot:4203667-Prymnesium_polylepis.2
MWRVRPAEFRIHRREPKLRVARALAARRLGLDVLHPGYLLNRPVRCVARDVAEPCSGIGADRWHPKLKQALRGRVS